MDDLQTKIGKAIINVNNIESDMNDVIANYYTKQEDADYEDAYFNILGDIIQTRHLSLGAKREILTSIFNRIDGLKIFSIKFSKAKFKRWVEIRNIFAHGELMSFNGEDSIRFNARIESPHALFREISELNKQVLLVLQEYNLYSGINKSRIKVRKK